MKVCIVGAGISGLTSAKILRELGHDVVVFEKGSDIGGVWGASKRYPGLATQNTKDTYCLSDMPMPKSYPEWPAGVQVQAYLEAYAGKHNLHEAIHLDCEVIEMKRPAGSKRGWLIKTGDGNETKADHVVICNGIFSDGAIPDYDGTADFKAKGGKVLHTSQIGDLDQVKGKAVIVVGYGKSACDLAHAVSEPGGASQTTVVARRLIWKLPRRIRGLGYKWLLLTRFGEALFEYINPSSFIERFLHHNRVGRGMRNAIVGALGYVVKGQLRLETLGLLPEGAFDTIARSTISLSTEGFYDKVARKQIDVRKDVRITRVGTSDKSDKQQQQLGATLSDGSFVPGDIIACGTGFRQQTPAFLPEKDQATLIDEKSHWLLYRHIKPLYVEDLTFNGYNSSLFCPTSSESAALWIGAYLSKGDAMLPKLEEQVRATKEKLAWLDKRSMGKHASGTNLVPFSLHSIDDTLNDIGLNIGPFARLKQWLLPVDPTAYRHLPSRLKSKLSQA
ncbi:FAD/NAD(P)-binding domain-containing protein [Acaromyces ingoldii]|uniref:FAD/NAD(P)-binding domain-containing protein n=1 Tax=Acaromyces ingoldii TaxID=215250 RepID=A0A316YRJ3_9BASI|nr:FAD/NAD(P)-binding domain-containing protein [Acaromyces ingoldii]PWN91861.1 FAD/NAD(P)-binding domain-containing protein [Acaromyces ingoldii]